MNKNGNDVLRRIADQAAATVFAARSQAAERAPVTADRVKSVGSNLIDTAREQLPHLQQRVNEQAKPAAQTLASQVQDLAATGGERAREVTTKVNEEVLPTLRDVALNAASAAVELWEAARMRAEKAAQEAQHEIAPVARHGLFAGRGKARKTSHQVAERVSDTAEHARQASRQAADATVSTGRDAGATLLWGAAAAGIIYYALMDKQRREQTLRMVNELIGGTRELIKDVRGHDAQF